MADQKVTELTENTTPIGTDLLYTVDDPGGAPASRKATIANIIGGLLQAMELSNEVKNFPANVGIDVDLVAANQWWDTVGTPSTACTQVDIAGEAGITETWEYALKIVADGATEGFYQRYTYADEPRVKLGRSLSAIAAVWVGTAGSTVTMKLVTSAATEVAATATAQAWTIIKCEGLVLDGTYVDLQFTIGGADTFYVVPLGVNIGTKALPLRPRELRYRHMDTPATIKALASLGDEATWTDIDVTANTGNLAVMAQVASWIFDNTVTDAFSLHLRRNGSATANGQANQIAYIQTDASGMNSENTIILDDAQIFEYYFDRTAGSGTLLAGEIDIRGWWEWA